MAAYEHEETTVLAVASILKSKKRALQFLKGIPTDTPEAKLLIETRKYLQDLKAKKRASAANAASPESVTEQRNFMFFLRSLMLLGLPHKPVKKESISRVIRTGADSSMTITLKAERFKEGVMLPYGIGLRRVLAIICTLVVQSRQEVITLASAAEFLRRLGLRTDAKGGIGGREYQGLARILEQIEGMSIRTTYRGFYRGRKQAENMTIIRQYDLPAESDDRAVDGGAQPLVLEHGGAKNFKIRVDPIFKEELIGNPETGIRGHAFPVPERFLRAFDRSTELDTANFLLARVSPAKSTSVIDMHSIHEQLGFHSGNYSRFKSEFTKTLVEVKKLWLGCNANVVGHDLIVGPVLNGDYLVDPTTFDTLATDQLFEVNAEDG